MLNSLRRKISFDNPVRLFWHWTRAVCAANLYGFPGKNMVIIGITGTNGKTTTTHMVESILRNAGKKVAMMSTVELRINGEVTPNLSKKTTLSPFVTQLFLRKCSWKNIDYVVLEASSHALHQYRLWGIPFSIAAITNITHEHLDYHGTLEKYAQAKRRLFKWVARTARKKKGVWGKQAPHEDAIILNAADRFFESFVKIKGPKKISYGINQGDLQAKAVRHTEYESSFSVRYLREQVDIKMKLAGDFNVENALAAIGVALSCGLSLDETKKGLDVFEGVPGRLERIKSPKGFEVIVDFALTPDALDRLYETIRPLCHGKLIGIIGSCGERDKKKRPDMGKVVAEHTDVTIVTDEESYSENPMEIMEAVLAGAKQFKKLGRNLHLIPDRYQAIEFAVKSAKKGDMVVVTGMGSFTTRNTNTGPIAWDEREVVREIIAKYS